MRGEERQQTPLFSYVALAVAGKPTALTGVAAGWIGAITSLEGALRGGAEALAGFMREYGCPRRVLEGMVREDGGSWSTTV